MAGIEAIKTTYVENPVSSVTFSSIPQAYEHLQIRVSGGFDSSGNGGHQVFMRFNGNTNTHYSDSMITAYSGANHNADRYGGSFSYVYGAGRITGPLVRRPEFGVSLIDIVDYTNPYKKKMMMSIHGNAPGYDGSSIMRLGGAFLDNTAAITTVLLYPPSGNFVRGTSISLYGVND
jgi:hypothetical protein